MRKLLRFVPFAEKEARRQNVPHIHTFNIHNCLLRTKFVEYLKWTKISWEYLCSKTVHLIKIVILTFRTRTMKFFNKQFRSHQRLQHTQAHTGKIKFDGISHQILLSPRQSFVSSVWWWFLVVCCQAEALLNNSRTSNSTSSTEDYWFTVC